MRLHMYSEERRECQHVRFPKGNSSQEKTQQLTCDGESLGRLEVMRRRALQAIRSGAVQASPMREVRKTLGGITCWRAVTSSSSTSRQRLALFLLDVPTACDKKSKLCSGCLHHHNPERRLLSLDLVQPETSAE